MKSIQHQLMATLVVLAAVLGFGPLAGCGGGGGGTEAPSPTESGPQLSGLVPAAPALGATLYADAASLRPLTERATWSYRGLQTKGTLAARYETSTQQTSVTATGASESASNFGNSKSADTVQLQLAAGEISSTDFVDITGKGQPGNLKLVELRSPVRAGDQYVMVDARYTDTNSDVDRDGRPDAIDLAVYGRVVGQESVDLPNLGTIQAVRVDTVVRLRVRPSSQTEPGPIVETTISNYYAQGVGIVRVKTTAVAPGSDTEITDELLVKWDGVNTGLGAMAAVDAVIPQNNSVYPGQTIPGDGADIVSAAFSNHALVITASRMGFGDSLVSKVDRLGRVVSTRLLPNYSMHSSKVPLPHAGGIAFLEQGPGGDSHVYSLTRLDSEGQLVGAVRGVNFNFTGPHLVNMSANAIGAISDDGVLWVLIFRSYRDLSNQGTMGPISSELVLRRYSLDGVLLGPEVVMPPAGIQFWDAQVVASQNEALAVFVSGEQGSDLKVLKVDRQGAAVVSTVASGLASVNTFVSPLKVDQRYALLWSNELGTGRNLGAAGGVLMSSDLAAVRAGTTWLDEQLPWMPPFASLATGFRALGTRVVSSGTIASRLWADDSTDSSVSVVGWLDVNDNTALALKKPRAVRFAAESSPRAHALFDDRLLIFGNRSGGLTTTVVWMPR